MLRVTHTTIVPTEMQQTYIRAGRSRWPESGGPSQIATVQGVIALLDREWEEKCMPHAMRRVLRKATLQSLIGENFETTPVFEFGVLEVASRGVFAWASVHAA